MSYDEPVKDTKPVIDDNEKIQIKVYDEHDYQIVYKIKPTTPFSKIFDNYAYRSNCRRDELRFYFDGYKLKDTDTVQSIGKLQDGDVIEVLRHYIGGLY